MVRLSNGRLDGKLTVVGPCHRTEKLSKESYGFSSLKTTFLLPTEIEGDFTEDYAWIGSYLVTSGWL